MDVISAYRDVGTYRGAADICGTAEPVPLSIADMMQRRSLSRRAFLGAEAGDLEGRRERDRGHECRPARAQQPTGGQSDGHGQGHGRQRRRRLFLRRPVRVMAGSAATNAA